MYLLSSPVNMFLSYFLFVVNVRLQPLFGRWWLAFGVIIFVSTQCQHGYHLPTYRMPKSECAERSLRSAISAHPMCQHGFVRHCRASKLACIIENANSKSAHPFEGERTATAVTTRPRRRQCSLQASWPQYLRYLVAEGQVCITALEEQLPLHLEPIPVR